MTSCHAIVSVIAAPGSRVALVGSPNVGKSVFFHRLTGQFATVSNYPGTTVEILQGQSRLLEDTIVVDTPGIVSFPARSEDEAVTARVLLEDSPQAILQVGDAKNLRRTLYLSVQLAELGLPMALTLNMMDEAEARGLSLKPDRLSDALGFPVAASVATRGQGMQSVLSAVRQANTASLQVAYPGEIESALAELEPLLPAGRLAQRGLGLLWLSGDTQAETWLSQKVDPAALKTLQAIRSGLTAPEESVRAARNTAVDALALTALAQPTQPAAGLNGVKLGAWLSRVSIHPLWGLPLLALVLFGLYEFVGVLGAGTLVGLLENGLFGQVINPWVTAQISRLIPIAFFSDLLVGPYGLWTMGMTYAVALLLPIVLTFFIAFGMLEDSGYLPRLAVLTNQFFTRLGLNGQAVLPMVLGLGCVTMATLTTRILPSKRERLLVTLLLALAVPCSAQLGVVMGMLASVSASAGLIWGAVVLAVLFAVGWLASKLVPGQRAPLMVELPPLRWPVFSNVLLKTLARLEWYVKEALPLFILGTLLLFALDKLKLLPVLIRAGEPLVQGWLGLPPEAASSFLLGLLRRDFAATGLFHMQMHGLLSPVQVVVSITTITLFIPCVASIFMIAKERGGRMALGMMLFIFPFAMLVGGLLMRLLVLVGWNG